MRIRISSPSAARVVLVVTHRASALAECTDAIQSAGLVGVGVDGASAALAVARTLLCEAVIVDGELPELVASDVARELRPFARSASFALVGSGVRALAGFDRIDPRCLDGASVRSLVHDMLGEARARASALSAGAPSAPLKPLARTSGFRFPIARARSGA